MVDAEGARAPHDIDWNRKFPADGNWNVQVDALRFWGMLQVILRSMYVPVGAVPAPGEATALKANTCCT
jgi:hypothetical protein